MRRAEPGGRRQLGQGQALVQPRPRSAPAPGPAAAATAPGRPRRPAPAPRSAAADAPPGPGRCCRHRAGRDSRPGLQLGLQGPAEMLDPRVAQLQPRRDLQPAGGQAQPLRRAAHQRRGSGSAAGIGPALHPPTTPAAPAGSRSMSPSRCSRSCTSPSARQWAITGGPTCRLSRRSGDGAASTAWPVAANRPGGEAGPLPGLLRHDRAGPDHRFDVYPFRHTSETDLRHPRRSLRPGA